MNSEASRARIVERLRAYATSNQDRADTAERIIAFVESTPTCAERSHLAGHLTGSAWIVNESRTKALLLHHKKLNRWMQPGGHADGDLDLLSVAFREAREETGMESVSPASPEVFDVDIHEIPPFKDIPAHYHYDVRFLFIADDQEAPRQNDESNKVAWIEVSEIHRYTDEESVLRMARK